MKIKKIYEKNERNYASLACLNEWARRVWMDAWLGKSNEYERKEKIGNKKG